MLDPELDQKSATDHFKQAARIPKRREQPREPWAKFTKSPPGTEADTKAHQQRSRACMVGKRWRGNTQTGARTHGLAPDLARWCRGDTGRASWQAVAASKGMSSKGRENAKFLEFQTGRHSSACGTCVCCGGVGRPDIDWI